MAILGSLDRVTEDGVVEGWAWDDERPGQQVKVSIFADGMNVGSTIALLFRGDLADAGIGDGRHSLQFLLPYTVFGQGRGLRVTLREASTGLEIGSPFVLYRKAAAKLDDRIVELERRIRLLQSRLEDALDQTSRETATSSAALFQTTADFFTRLAADTAAGVSASGAGLSDLIRTVSMNYETLILPRAAAPVATICITAGARLADVYACLAAIATNVGAEADVVLLDDGRYDDVPLLPSLVRNLRYVRIQDGILAERNRLADEVRTDFIVFMSPYAHPDPQWLSEVREAFNTFQDAGAVGSKVVRQDGVTEHAGLMLEDATRFRDFGVGEVNRAGSGDFVRRCDALGDYAAAFRRNAFTNAGGFDTTLGEPAAATLDLCFRLRGHGCTTVFQSLGSVLWTDAKSDRTRWVVEDLNLPDDANALLLDRWSETFASMLISAEKKPKTALLLSQTPNGAASTIAEEMRRISFFEKPAGTLIFAWLFDDENVPEYKMLLRQGIRALRKDCFKSLGHFLQMEGQTIGVMYSAAALGPQSEIMSLMHLLPHAEIVVESEM